MKTYNELKNELEGKISALEVAKQDLVLKIRDLNTLVQGESTITDGVYDTYSSPEPKTKGSKEDIQNLRNEIDKISDKIKQLLKEKADLENNKEEIESRIEEKKRSEEERKQLEKEEKIQLFKNVKRSYKSGNLWERFILKVQGESPDWNRIKKYDINELRYLDKASRGDIRLTQESVKNKTDGKR